MPAWTKEEEGGSALRRRAAKASRDKAVEAQRKNKLETAQLSLFNAMVDRKKVHAIVSLNREKDELRAGMKRMRKTTGFCKQGLPPAGPEDKDHKKSPYFQTLGHVSEKRLQKWKNEERALQRILISEEELRPPWEKDSVELAEETLSHLLNLLGYDEEEAKKMLISLKENKEKKDDETNDESSIKSQASTFEEKQTTIKGRGYLHSASASSFGAMSTASDPFGRIDVFECLRDGTDSNSNPEITMNGGRQRPFQSKGLASASADDFSRSSRDSSFSLRDWEKQMTARYKKSLVNPRERRETPGETSDNKSLKSRPKSAPVKTGNALRRRTLLSRRRQKSSEESPEKGKSLPETTSITDLREEDTEGVNVTDTGMADITPSPPTAPRRPRPHTALPPRAVQATRGLVVDHSRPATAYRKAPQPPASKPRSESNSYDEPEGKSNESPSRNGVQKANAFIQSVPKSQNNGVKLRKAHAHASTPDLSSGKKEDELNAIIEEEREEVTAIPDRNRKGSVHHKGPALPVGRRRYSLARPEGCSSSSRSTHTGGGGGRFQRSQSLNADSLPSPTSVHTSPPPGDANSHSRAAFRSRRHTVAAFEDILDDDTGSEAEDEPQSKENELRAQWRRNLLKEAPPGFGGRDEKIRLAVSKSQLRRDMEQMVVEHESDIRETIRKEHMRRMRKRMDIVLTLQKLAKKPEEEEAEVTETPSKGSNGTKLVTQVGTIMQMLKLKKMAQQVKAKRVHREPEAVEGQVQNEVKV